MADTVVFGVDTGGSFTDVFTSAGTIAKVPSTPDEPTHAILEGLRRAGLKPGAMVAHGTTVATNAVLERKGAKTALLTTLGFEDVLEIRRQNRPSLYDLDARWPEPLIPRSRRLGVVERVDYTGAILTPLDTGQLESVLDQLEHAEIEAAAICLLFSYLAPDHERLLMTKIRERLGSGFAVCASHQLAPQYGEYERTSTTVLNAYVMPIMSRYLDRLQTTLTAHGVSQLLVMHSNGGLVRSVRAIEAPVTTILSGPAAGVIGARAIAGLVDRRDIITIDMGGTSTDVAVVPGHVLETTDAEIDSFPLFVSMLAIETVGAGGGSLARVDQAGGLHVGPESAGAAPGPAAYGHGGPPTVTDAHVVLGRIGPRGLLGGELLLDIDRARQSLLDLAERLEMSIEQVAWAIIQLANSNMERTVRAISLQRGHDPRRFCLVALGGAGPLHAAELASDLGMGTVLVPPHPGVVAALGLTVPDIQRDFVQTVLIPLGDGADQRIASVVALLEGKANAALSEEQMSGFGDPVIERFADVRFVGQSFELRVPLSDAVERVRADFLATYRAKYHFLDASLPIEIVHLRLRATLPRLEAPNLRPSWSESSITSTQRTLWTGERLGVQDVHQVEAVVQWRPALPVDSVIVGPAIIEQYDCTTLVPSGWRAVVDTNFNLVLTQE